jgi:glycosyltransferase involved in cell wall biosynthesis
MTYSIRSAEGFSPKSNYKIGVGITCHNRHRNTQACLIMVKRYTPEAHRIVVVDDASDVPFGGSSFRFRHNAGVAKAKNKCLELLDDCDYIFLFDDDTWPKVHKWWEPYINSRVHSLSFTFDRLVNGVRNGNNVFNVDDRFKYHVNPCGCMLFMTKELLDKIGGFDICFGQYGNEHVDFSVRSYLSGMVPHPFMDISFSMSLFDSLDYRMLAKTSVKSRNGVINTSDLIGRKGGSYIPYRSMGDRFLVLTSYFNYREDPQRNMKWDPDFNKVMPLVNSVVDHGGSVVVFHDCFDQRILPTIDGVEWRKCEPDAAYNPYIYRHKAYLDYLISIDENLPVFGVDSSDVICLSSPKDVKSDFLYVGNEHGQVVASRWLRNDERPYAVSIQDYGSVIIPRMKETLLNCGIIGGFKNVYLDFLQKIWDLSEVHARGVYTSTDMPLGNYVFFKHFYGKIASGPPLNTKFKHHERVNGAWFQHK